MEFRSALRAIDVTAAIVEHVGPDGEVSRLPAGERVLWSGAPEARSVARFLLRERWVLGFVAFSFAIGAADALQHPTDSVPRLIGVATLSLILALIAISSIRLLAWRLAKTSSYVVTDRRVYFNIGIVLRADANIPYAVVDGVDLLRRPDGSADLMLSIGGEREIPWLLLFPHMSWRGSRRGRPTFRGIRESEAAAAAVVGALRAYPMPSEASGAIAGSAVGAPAERSARAVSATPSPA